MREIPSTPMLVAAFQAAVDAADPRAAVEQTLHRDRHDLLGEGRGDEVAVVSIGKAAAAMVEGASNAASIRSGIAVSSHATPCPVPLILGDHPIPGDQSVRAGRAIIEFLEALPIDLPVLFLISGGGSSLVEVPADGVSLADLETLNRALLASGLDIVEMNELRSAVSSVKGGRLVDHVHGPSASLLLSDIAGDKVRHIASGPTVGHGIGGRAAAVLEGSAIRDELSAGLIRAIEDYRPAPPVQSHPFRVVASPTTAAQAAAAWLEANGVESRISPEPLSGDGQRAVERMLSEPADGVVTISAGETTVRVANPNGLGGRNQHAALLAARSLAGRTARFLAAGTDGIDGETAAAGAVIDGDTHRRLTAAGGDIDTAIDGYGSHRALGASSDLIMTGPTGTNVADVWMYVGLD